MAIRILDSGRPLVIFPEGTRSKDRGLKGREAYQNISDEIMRRIGELKRESDIG